MAVPGSGMTTNFGNDAPVNLKLRTDVLRMENRSNARSIPDDNRSHATNIAKPEFTRQHQPLLDPIARKLATHLSLDATDEDLLRSLQSGSRIFEKGSEIVDEGQESNSVYLLLAGWICSYKILRNGTRQVIDFQIPGDIIGLRSLLLARSDHSFCAVTRVELAQINARELTAAFRGSNRLATSILWAASRDKALVVEHLVSLGRRSALERSAHFFLELSARLAVLETGHKQAFDCPLTQPLIADSLGLTSIHLNRTLRSLREMELLTFQGGKVTILDYERLSILADFNGDYLE